MIDLHTHTNYSDGTWETKRILTEAQKIGVTTLSITDHNTVDAYYEIQKIDDINKYFCGRIINGAEFDIMFHGSKIEFLGYDFDLDKMNDSIKEIYGPLKLDLDKEFQSIYKNCIKNNLKIDNIEYDSKSGKYPIYTIYEALKKYEENKSFFSDDEWNNVDYLFRACSCNPNFPLYLDFSYMTPSAKIISDAIRANGGKVFIAHIWGYNLPDPLKYLDMLRKENLIDGVEVCHYSFTDEQMSFLQDYCKKYNLLMSGGSDCHGDKKNDRKIGIGNNNLNIQEDLVSNWLDINKQYN